jgi:hypothetical protein
MGSLEVCLWLFIFPNIRECPTTNFS